MLQKLDAIESRTAYVNTAHVAGIRWWMPSTSFHAQSPTVATRA